MPVIDSYDGGDTPAPYGGSPCAPYIQRSDWADDARLCGAEVPDEEWYSAAASDLLYALLGRQFPGACTATVRPIPTGGGCWEGFVQSRFLLGSLGNDLTTIELHNPVQEIIEVKIDGVVVTDWYLRDGYKLVRPAGWPSYSSDSLILDDGQAGTFSITYSYGARTPYLVAVAATELAIHLWLADHPNVGSSVLKGVDSASRQGMNVSVRDNLAAAREAGPALPNTTNAIAAYNPRGYRTPPDVYSFDAGWDLVIVA